MTTALPGKAPRLLSLDAFRGLTIAAMILVNNPGSWGAMYAPLGHADWHGCTPTDLIFPFFLFIVGVAIPFSFAARRARGASSAMLARGVVFRALSLVMLGLLLVSVPRSLPAALPAGYELLGVLQWVALGFVPVAIVLLLWPWKSDGVGDAVVAGVAAVWLGIYLAIYHTAMPDGYAAGSGLTNPWAMRYPGVLQRIGLVYLFAGMAALFLGWRAIAGLAGVLLVGYTVAMNVYGPTEKADNLARMIDVAVFGKHAYGAYPDPEGLLSTIPAIATCLLGILAGFWLKSSRDIHDRSAGLLAAGVVGSVAGVLLGWWSIPLNKQIWTPSFVVLTAGLACLTFGACFYAIDVKQKRRWCVPLVAFGMNAITTFLLAGIVGRMMALVKLPYEWLPAAAPWAKVGAKVPTTLPETVGLQGFLAQWAGHMQRAVTPAMAHTPEAASLAYALWFVAGFTVLAMAMYKAKIFLKV